MAVRHPHPDRPADRRVRIVAEGALALALVACLVAAVVSALAWALVTAILIVVD